jgi:hypothetical protein
MFARMNDERVAQAREPLGLGWPLIDAIECALGLLEREPAAGHELRGRLRGLRSLRVGAYRVIYQLTDEDGQSASRRSATARSSIASTRADSAPVRAKGRSATEAPAGTCSRSPASDRYERWVTWTVCEPMPTRRPRLRGPGGARNLPTQRCSWCGHPCWPKPWQRPARAPPLRRTRPSNARRRRVSG